MSRWLQDVILDAGFPGGSARDVRSVGATTAVQINMDINRVLEATNWQRVVHPAKTLFQTTVSPVTDRNFECYQLVCDYFLLLLLAGIFFVATVS